MLGHGSDQVIYLTINKQVNCSVSKSCSNLWFDRNTLLPSVDAEISLQKVRWIFVLILAPFPYSFCLFFYCQWLLNLLRENVSNKRHGYLSLFFLFWGIFSVFFVREKSLKIPMVSAPTSPIIFIIIYFEINTKPSLFPFPGITSFIGQNGAFLRVGPSR